MRTAALLLTLILLGGCAGVLDLCPDGLKPPPGGWYGRGSGGPG